MNPDDEDSQRDEQRGPLSRRAIILLGLVTLVGFGGIGWLLIELVQQRSIATLLLGPAPLHVQLASGAALGAALGLIGVWLGRRPFMQRELMAFAFIGRSVDRWHLILFLSVCAGVGEEIFFRGALQFWLGIPIAAIVFVLIHGYLNPMNWRISVYGVFMTVGIMIVGWLAEQHGLTAAITAHAVIDIIAFRELARMFANRMA